MLRKIKEKRYREEKNEKTQRRGRKGTNKIKQREEKTRMIWKRTNWGEKGKLLRENQGGGC